MEKKLICIITEKPLKKEIEYISLDMEVKYFYYVEESCIEALDEAEIVVLVPEKFYKLYEYEELIPEEYHSKCLCLAKNLSDWHVIKERGIFSYWIFYDLFVGREYSLYQFLNILCAEKPIVSIYKEDLFAVLQNKELVVMQGYEDESHIDIKGKVLLAHVYGEAALNDIDKFYEQTEPEIMSIVYSKECKKQYTLLVEKGKWYSKQDREKKKGSIIREVGVSPVFSTALISVGIVLLYIFFNSYICRGIVFMEGQCHVTSGFMSGVYFLAIAMVLIQLERVFLDVFCEMKLRKVLGYMLFPAALCMSFRLVLECFLILFPMMVVLMLLHMKKRFSKRKEKCKKGVILDTFFRFMKISILILSVIFCVKEVVIRVTALKSEWTIKAKEYEVEDFYILKFYEDLSFYQKLELSKRALSNELFLLDLDIAEPVRFVIENNSESGMLGYFNHETRTVGLDIKCIEQQDNKQCLRTIVHEAYHVRQFEWITQEKELELSFSEREMLSILKDEFINGIYIEELVALQDRYAQYYHSLTEYFARRYQDEHIKWYWSKEKGDENCVIPAMEYFRWLKEIPKRNTE